MWGVACVACAGVRNHFAVCCSIMSTPPLCSFHDLQPFTKCCLFSLQSCEPGWIIGVSLCTAHHPGLLHNIVRAESCGSAGIASSLRLQNHCQDVTDSWIIIGESDDTHPAVYYTVNEHSNTSTHFSWLPVIGATLHKWYFSWLFSQHSGSR